MKKSIFARFVVPFLFLLSPLLSEGVDGLTPISETAEQGSQKGTISNESNNLSPSPEEKNVSSGYAADLFRLEKEETLRERKHVFFALLARNKEHILPTYLKCLENLEYDKKDITLYINTNNNTDRTEEILTTWTKEHEPLYRKIIFESHNVEDLYYGSPHEWTMDRLHTLALIRNKSLKLASEEKSDYYFVVDCDNFIIPSTLADLVAKDLPIVAPMLHSIPEPVDITSNFFAAVKEDGYYKHSNEFSSIIFREKIGTFKVPLVHCTYLIKTEYLNKLSYTDETEDYEFIIFARLARKNNISQYICNEKVYGYNINFLRSISLKEEKEVFPLLIPRIEKLVASVAA